MKRVVIFFTAVAIAAAVNAQSPVKFGVKAGANLSTWGGDDKGEAKSQFNFHVGGLVNIPVSSMFSVQPEIVFSNEGAKFDDDVQEDVKYNLNFVNIPVMLQYNNPSGFYAETGPQIGFMVSAKQKIGSQDDDWSDSFKSTSFSWGLGAGFKTKSGFGFGARYNLGLNSIVESEEAEVKQNNLAIGVFYLFGGSK